MDHKVSVIVSSICMPLGASVMLFSLLSEFSLFFFFSGGLLLLLPIVLMKNKFRRPAAVETKTFEWYRGKYPDSVQGDIITCSKCETNSIDVRAVKNELFHREIYCTECGKTLYYFSLA